MSFLDSLDFWFWIPVVFWVGLYFWFYRGSYPLYLKKQMRKGQKWAFVPASRGNLLLLDVLFSTATSVASVLPAIWIVHKCSDAPWYWGFVVVPLCLVASFVVSGVAKKKTATLFQAAYFLEYRKVRYESEIKGNFRSEVDVHNRTVWSYTKKLKNAEAHHRLWKYVNAMAKTKKIPPDVYAETMYV